MSNSLHHVQGCYLVCVHCPRTLWLSMLRVLLNACFKLWINHLALIHQTFLVYFSPGLSLCPSSPATFPVPPARCHFPSTHQMSSDFLTFPLTWTHCPTHLLTCYLPAWPKLLDLDSCLFAPSLVRSVCLLGLCLGSFPWCHSPSPLWPF